jgi:4-amino-4-deoxy-L-arabinose transferase-like glycosyltransferase
MQIWFQHNDDGRARMKKLRDMEAVVFSDLGILILLALARCATLLLSNGQCGWHRDELDTLDNAHYLAWGYVAYPPFAPFIARIALTLFGSSIIGVRLFSTLAQVMAMILAGLMVREMGGRRWAQIVAAVAVAIAPFALLGGNLFHYSSFDYLWWVLIAYLMIRLLKSENPRWWLGIGSAIGIGMMTKYTIAFLVIGLVISVILTRTRRYLLSPWLWGGVALALLIVMPNLIWQIQHDFISLDFMSSIHARDVRIGRAEGFLIEQLIFSANVVTTPLWLAGLYFYLFAKTGRSYRAIGWMFAITFALIFIAQGRSYYLAPAYPMLFAGGAVMLEGWLTSLSVGRARLIKGVMWGIYAVGGIVFAVVALPVAPVNSQVWNAVSEINGELKEQIGWPELVETVAGIYDALPAEDRPQTGILTGNYGEAGAINLYGSAYGLPKAISGVNSYWMRGYGDPPPQILIVIGLDPGIVYSLFESCRAAGRVTNRYGVLNEETENNPQILLCGAAHRPWPELWERLRSFG